MTIAYTTDDFKKWSDYAEAQEFDAAIMAVSLKNECVPYSQAETHLQEFAPENCDKATRNCYQECKKAFEAYVCDASNYICRNLSVGDCESISGQEEVCIQVTNTIDYSTLGYEYF